MDNSKKKELVASIRIGDETAFREVYHEYVDKLYYYCLRFVKSQELAEELVQQIFVKLWDVRKSLNTELSFDAFLYRITKNHTLNFLKKAAYESRVKNEIISHSSFKENETENRIIMDETLKVLNSVIEKLPEKRQLIYKLSKIDGLDNSEIAQKLGISKNTVKVQLVKASKFVREQILFLKEVS